MNTADQHPPLVCSSVRPSAVVVSLEHRFVRVGDAIYTDLAFDRKYWAEYLDVFESVVVFARVKSELSIPVGYKRADGPRIAFAAAPYYLGMASFFRTLPRLMVSAFKTSIRGDSFILRSGNISTALWIILVLTRRPFAREVQGDVKSAITAFLGESRTRAKGSTIAWASDYLCRVQVRGASCVSYVSRATRDRYPAKRGTPEFIFSGVSLTDLPTLPNQANGNEILRILCVGRLSPEKGQEYLVRALAAIRNQGMSAELVLVGPGPDLTRLQSLVRSLKVDEHVRFTGGIEHGDPLWAECQAADIYVQPSLTEGMPRALIEAMALGLPAIGTNAGGIPELLTKECIVPPRDHLALANAITRLSGQPEELMRLAIRNRDFAFEAYGEGTMTPMKHQFWAQVAGQS